LVVAHTLLTTLAAQRSTLAPRKRLVLAGGVGAYLIAWLAVAITFGDRNNFSTRAGASSPPARPRRGVRPTAPGNPWSVPVEAVTPGERCHAEDMVDLGPDRPSRRVHLPLLSVLRDSAGELCDSSRCRRFSHRRHDAVGGARPGASPTTRRHVGDRVEPVRHPRHDRRARSGLSFASRGDWNVSPQLGAAVHRPADQHPRARVFDPQFARRRVLGRTWRCVNILRTSEVA